MKTNILLIHFKLDRVVLLTLEALELSVGLVNAGRAACERDEELLVWQAVETEVLCDSFLELSA